MARMLELANKNAVAIVEDAAQAHGSKLDGNRMGSVGLLGCFSFHPSKNLAAAGDGGAIATNDARLAGEIERHRSLGQAGQNHHVVVGYNSKLDAMQAQILHWKLAKLDEWNEARRRVAEWYRERLRDLPLAFQSTSPDELHVYHLFAIRTDRRDELLAHLQRLEVDAVVRYPTPIHLQPAFADYGWKAGQFPVAEKLAKELLCLPIRPNMTTNEVDYVADCARAFFRGTPGA
jgi:dTDP-4-amino-4,6-dideoxygalactose transaminase